MRPAGKALPKAALCAVSRPDSRPLAEAAIGCGDADLPRDWLSQAASDISSRCCV